MESNSHNTNLDDRSSILPDYHHEMGFQQRWMQRYFNDKRDEYTK